MSMTQCGVNLLECNFYRNMNQLNNIFHFTPKLECSYTQSILIIFLFARAFMKYFDS